MLTIQELLILVSKFMSQVNSKIKVEVYPEADDDIPTVIVTFPSKIEYLIGCDHNQKNMDRYRMRPKCFFASRGEISYSFDYYQPDDFDWIDIAINKDSVASVCVTVAMDEYKVREESFRENLEYIAINLEEDQNF
jgi:hypothetical protein